MFGLKRFLALLVHLLISSKSMAAEFTCDISDDHVENFDPEKVRKWNSYQNTYKNNIIFPSEF